MAEAERDEEHDDGDLEDDEGRVDLGGGFDADVQVTGNWDALEPRGNVLLRVPKEFRLADPSGLWIAKDGNDAGKSERKKPASASASDKPPAKAAKASRAVAA